MKTQPEWYKDFWAVSQEEEFRIIWKQRFWLKVKKNPKCELSSVCLHGEPPGGAQLSSQPLCARHAMGVHRGTVCTPALKRGHLGLSKQARQGNRAGAVWEEPCRRGG